MHEKFENYLEKIKEQNTYVENELTSLTSRLYEQFQDSLEIAIPILIEALNNPNFTLRDTDGTPLEIYNLSKISNIPNDFYIELPGYNEVLSLKMHKLGKMIKKQKSISFAPFTKEQTEFLLRDKDFWESLSTILVLQVLENDIIFKNKQL